MIRKWLDYFNRNFTIKAKILFLFIPLMALLFFIFGEVSDSIYRYYIRQLAYNELRQRTDRLEADIESRLETYLNISNYLFVNEGVVEFVSKYGEDRDIKYDIYLDDYKKLQYVLGKYAVEGSDQVLYLFNKNSLTDGDFIREIEEYPDRDSIHRINDSRGRACWLRADGSHFLDRKDKLIIARAIYDERSRVSAILNVEIDLEIFSRIFELVNVGNSGYYRYCFEDGGIILSKGYDKGPERSELLQFSRKLPMNQSSLEMGFSGELITQMGRTQRNALGLLMLFFILLSITFTYLFSSFTVKRMKLFVEKINRIDHDGPIRPIEGMDEISLIDRNFNEMLQNLRENIRREHELVEAKAGIQAQLLKEQLKKKVVESELLQAQFNPHFLYNTLSAVRWSTIDNGDMRTGQILDKLVMFYRATLSSGKPIITIGRELEIIRNYIEIQKYTYDDEYSFEVEVGAELENLFCLKLILQPVVENSILHGFGELERVGWLKVAVRKEETGIIYTVEDNGAGMTGEKIRDLNQLNEPSGESASAGYGILNVIKRIKLYYGERYGVTYESILGKGTKVTITIPVCRTEDDNLLFREG